MSYTKVLLQV